MKRLLVACEFSGLVRDAFIAKGWNAWSCDLLPSERPGQHIQGDIRSALLNHWDMILAFPPCTHLAVSGARWFEEKRKDGRQLEGINFFLDMVHAISNIGCGAIENLVGIMSSLYRKPDQIVQPWQFGHGETKATCLWLFGLPKLKPTNIVTGREQRVWKMFPSPERAKERSRTYAGLALAMAEQWA